ncbi:rod shape-determining protein MreD [Porphyromonas macacae]|uniref:rod shape-determining protein MreD n=1 Tax=Porphyromonas macacae TaxID=28115 RepID=UPI0024AE2394|nr:rod shape-determining protein MreD [Porphyromonas macacae]
MLKKWIKLIFVSLLFIAAQVWLFNPISLFRYATPFIYPVLLLMFPINTSTGALTLFGFFTGLAIDALSGTPGLHTSAFTATAFLRNTLIRPFLGDNILEEGTVGQNMSNTRFYLLLLKILVVHLLLLMLLDAFSLFDPLYLLLRFCACVALSYMISVIIFLITGSSHRIS